MRLISLITYNALPAVALVSLIALISSHGTRVAQMSCPTCTSYANHVTLNPTCSTANNTGDGSGFRYEQLLLGASNSPSQSVNQTANIITQSFNACRSLGLKTPNAYYPNPTQTVTQHVAQSFGQRKTWNVFVRTFFKRCKTDTHQAALSQII